MKVKRRKREIKVFILIACCLNKGLQTQLFWHQHEILYLKFDETLRTALLGRTRLLANKTLHEILANVQDRQILQIVVFFFLYLSQFKILQNYRYNN